MKYCFLMGVVGRQGLAMGICKLNVLFTKVVIWEGSDFFSVK